MNQIQKDVKRIILKLSGFIRAPEELADETTLDDLGLDHLMCYELAVRLRTYLQIHNAIRTLDHTSINPELSVGDTVKLIKDASSILPIYAYFAPMVYK